MKFLERLWGSKSPAFSRELLESELMVARLRGDVQEGVARLAVLQAMRHRGRVEDLEEVLRGLLDAIEFLYMARAASAQMASDRCDEEGWEKKWRDWAPECVLEPWEAAAKVLEKGKEGERARIDVQGDHGDTAGKADRGREPGDGRCLGATGWGVRGERA